MKVWDPAGIKLATPGSAVRHASVASHVTDCATRPGRFDFQGLLKNACHFQALFKPGKHNTVNPELVHVHAYLVTVKC